MKTDIEKSREKAREKFETYLTIKGLDFEWDGTKYKTTNIQTKWRYFLLGYYAKEQA